MMASNCNVYVISGLGVDHRVFENINFGKYNVVHLAWIKPLPKETMKDYAKRMAAQISESQPIIIGLSFGGMLAVEMAQQIPYSKIILLASAKTYKELPFYYRLIGKMGLHHLAPNFIFSRANTISYWLFGVKGTQNKQLLSIILKETNKEFRTWAIHALLNWDNTFIPPNTIAIHGDKDKIIPIKNVKTDYTINGGGHFMTVDKAPEMSVLLQDILT